MGNYKKRPKKQELYDQIDELVKENIRLSNLNSITEPANVYPSGIDVNRYSGFAADVFQHEMDSRFPGLVRKARFEHVDVSGFWFTFELANDPRRQTYVVRWKEIGI